MTTCRPGKTPPNPSLLLLKEQQSDKRADILPYQGIVGSLNHLAIYSRPDTPFAVSKLSQFIINHDSYQDSCLPLVVYSAI
jgi:hypothetical protein